MFHITMLQHRNIEVHADVDYFITLGPEKKLRKAIELRVLWHGVVNCEVAEKARPPVYMESG